MPKAKDKSSQRRRQIESSDEDMPAGRAGSCSQATIQPTQSSTQPGAYSGSEQSELVNSIVRYLLIADQKKVPIKRPDIVKNCLKEHSRQFSAVMNAACEKLKDVFGIEAVYDEKAKGYILINTLDNLYNGLHQEWPPEDNARTGLVMVILTIISMKNHKVDDVVLFDVLRRLGIDTENRDETFGDVRRLIMTTFVKQGYLDVEREPGDPPKFIFQWGPRASLETTDQHIVDFVDHVYGRSGEQEQ